MELILTNKNGATLDLLNNDRRFILSACEGLHGLDTDIATAESPYLDGTLIENVKALPRGISMTFKLVPDIREAIDFFTSVVKTKQYVTLTEKEGEKEIIIKGIATIPPYSRMSALCEIALDIYCGQPYWEDIQQIVTNISLIIPKLNFPIEKGQFFTPVNGARGGRVFSVVDTSLEKTFTNDGDVEVGMNIRIIALGEVSNPTIYCSTGAQNGNYMRLKLTLSGNDEIEINTIKGNKYIRLNGSAYYGLVPLLSCLEFKGNDWLQLETGKNTFNITAEPSDAVYFSIFFKRRWE